MSLRLAFLALVFFQTLMVAVWSYLAHREWRSEQVELFQTESVAVRAMGAAASLNQALDTIQASLKNYVAALAEGTDAVHQSRLYALKVTGGISWVGIADPSGRLVESSDDGQLGQDVSSRSWFVAGLRGDFFGDAQDAALFGEGTAEVPSGFEVSMPILDRAGEITGVLGARIDPDWLSAYLAEIASALEVDVFLVGKDGTVKLGTAPLPTASLDLASVKAAAAGNRASGQDVWPDGNPYFATAVPSFRDSDMTGFDWITVARISPASFGGAVQSVSKEVQELLLVVLLTVLLTAFAFWRIYLAPVRRLAVAGREIAEGRLYAPPEETVTAEYQDLSLALARLQAKEFAAAPNLRSRPGPSEVQAG